AEYRDFQIFKTPLLLPYGQRVEECLRRVLVRSVACVYDRGAADARELVRRARRGVAYDDEVGRHRFEVARSVQESLALRHRRRGRADVDYVRRESLSRYLKRGARARRRLEEEVDDGAPAKRRHFLYLALGDFAEGLGGVEYVRYLFGAKAAYAEQV